MLTVAEDHQCSRLEKPPPVAFDSVTPLSGYTRATRHAAWL